MAATCSLVVWSVHSLVGPIPALIALGQFLVVDYRTRLFAREFLTESLAIFLAALLTIALFRFRKCPSATIAILAGLVAGLCVVTRTMFVLWLPTVAILLVWWERRHGDSDAPDRHAWIAPAAFLLAAFLVVSPWAVRNYLVLGSFRPLGTQGLIQASAGYSDHAMQSRGQWVNLLGIGFFDGIADDKTGLSRELAMADHSFAEARRWAVRSWFKLPFLAVMKVLGEFRPWAISELYITAFAALGLITLRSTDEARVALALVAACSIAIALTWSTGGRFTMPVLFILHIFAAEVVWRSFVAALRRA